MKILKYYDVVSQHFAATSGIEEEDMAIIIFAIRNNAQILCTDIEWLEVQQEIKQALLN